MKVKVEAAASATSTRIWFAVGLVFLAYAVLGNFLVLPGYRRFLEHGRPDSAGSGVDFVLIWGAARTILWMFSFQIGAFLLTYAALLAGGADLRRFRRWFVVGALAWLALWAVPALPGPYTIFFASVGIVILVMIVSAFGQAMLNAERDRPYFEPIRSGPWQIVSYFFFALATWDICGLGSVGGLLQPESAMRAANQPLMVAQTTKLIIELALAWSLLAVAAMPARAPQAVAEPIDGRAGAHGSP